MNIVDSLKFCERCTFSAPLILCEVINMLNTYEYTNKILQKIKYTLLSFVYAFKQPTPDNISAVFAVLNVVVPISVFCVLTMGLYILFLPFVASIALPCILRVRVDAVIKDKKERKKYTKKIDKSVTTINILAIISVILALIIHMCIHNSA